MAIIFLCLVLLAWFFYLRREKVYALLIFFFFLTSGFQLVQEEVMYLMPGFSKGVDYALVLIVGCIGFDFLFSKGRYFKWDAFTGWLLLFLFFLILCILYSHNSVGCTWNEALRASRQYFLFLAYFVFRNMNKEELKKLLYIFFIITVIQSGLYVMQAFLENNILVGSISSKISVGDWEFRRYYNQPMLLYFMTFLLMYKPPVKGLLKVFAICVFILAILLGFNRSAIGFTVIILSIGYVLHLPKIKQVRVIIISSAILIPTIAIIGHNFVKSRTFIDVKSVIDGNFIDLDFDLDYLYNSTFAFRMGHLFERISYLDENPEARIFGVGLIPEDSPKTDRFNFILGLMDETGKIQQLDTPDISYSVLIMRFGYLGSALFLMLYFYMLYFFFKNRKNEYAFVSFLFIVFLLLVSFFGSLLVVPIFFVMGLFSMSLVNKDKEDKELEISGQSSRN